MRKNGRITPMKNLEELLVTELKLRFQPDIIILYGSRARGDADINSDIDVACFCQKPELKKEARSFHGLSLDAWFYPTESMNPDNDEFLRLHDGCCLQDMDGTGRAFLNRLHERFVKGPAPIAEEERKHSTEWVRKMLQRASGNNIEALYRRSWLAVEILMIYFQLRDQWYCGPKKSFSWLEKNDPQALCLFQAAYQNPDNLPALIRLSEYVISTNPQQQP